MTLEGNKSLVRRYIEEVWNERNASAADTFFAPDYKRYLSPIAPPLDLEGQRHRISGFLAAFPDIHFEVEDVFGEEDLVVFRSTVSGTHRGDFQGVEPTGERIKVSLMDVVRIEDGKFTEHWGGPDMYDLFKQLGAEISMQQE